MLSLWLFGAGGAIFVGVAAFAAGSFWSSRRIGQRFISVSHSKYDGFTYENETDINNPKKLTPSHSAPVSDQPDNNI